MDDSPGPEPVERPDDAVEPQGGAADEAIAGDEAVAGEDAVAGADAVAGEDAIAGEDTVAGRDPRRFNDWRKRSATGAVMTGIALGLREALELPRERPALVIEAPGEPDDPDHPIDLRFDPDSPEGTVAIVRQREGGGSTGAPGRP